MTLSTHQTSIRPVPALPAPNAALRRAVDEIGVKAVAARLNVSTALVYKWIEPHGSVDDSGAHSPLSRFCEIIRLLQEFGMHDEVRVIAEYVCVYAGGTFVPRPAPVSDVPSCVVLASASAAVRLVNVASVMANAAQDGRFDGEELVDMRHAWTGCDSLVESTLAAGESGLYSGRA